MKNQILTLSILVFGMTILPFQAFCISTNGQPGDKTGGPLRSISQVQQLIQVVKEADLIIEKWMTDQEYLPGRVISISAEPELPVESWMNEPLSADLSQYNETALPVENWMKEAINLPVQWVTEKELEVEPWMTRPIIMDAEPTLRIEPWMTISL